MLDYYIIECRVSIININNDIKKAYSVNTNQIMVFDKLLKVSESLYSHIVIWINTILNPIDTRTNLLRFEGSCTRTVSKTQVSSNIHTH
jgi:hypothetical protein